MRVTGWCIQAWGGRSCLEPETRGTVKRYAKMESLQARGNSVRGTVKEYGHDKRADGSP